MTIKEIFGSEIRKTISEAFYTPEETIDGFESVVRPVLDVKPLRTNKVVRATTTSTAYTCSTEKDTYLLGSNLTIAHTLGVQALLEATVNAIPKGQAVVACNNIRTYKDAANSVNVVSNSNHPPILLERGSTISVVLEGTSSAVIYLLEEESYSKRS